MPDFNAKMHQNRFRLGHCPRPRRRAYCAPPGPLAGFKGPTSKGRGREGGERRGGGARPVCLLVDNPGYGPDRVVAMGIFLFN